MRQLYKLILFILSISFSSSQGLDPAYHSNIEINKLLDSLSNLQQYEDIFSLDTIGFSSNENLPILAVKISDNAHIREDEPRVLFVGQVHAEEVLGIEIVLDLMMDLLKPDPSDANHVNILVNYLEIYIVPTANPEGLNVVHEGLDLTFRKNKTDFSPLSISPNNIFDYEPSIGNDIDGVDLNRNFDFNWFFGDTFLVVDESDYASHFDYYRGEEPFSEPEAIALRDLALENNFVFSIVWHSSRSGRLSEKIFTSWQWADGKLAPDTKVMKNIADEFSLLMPTEDGSSSYLPVFSGSRNGKLHDWFYRETGCFQFLIECGTSNIQPDSSLLFDTIERTKPSMYYLMDRVIGYYVSASQITGRILNQDTNQPIPGAIVKILESHSSVLKLRKTDEFGRFRRILDVGTYTIEASAKGYLRKEMSLVANSSAPTEIDIVLEPSPTYSLEINFVDYITDDSNPFIIINNNFGSDTLDLSINTLNQIDLHQGEYELLVYIDGHVPWEKSLYFSSDLSFSIPVLSSESINLVDEENWENLSQEWIFNSGYIKSQQDLLYKNISDSINLAMPIYIETNFLDVSGGNRLVLDIDHRFETEWDSDYIFAEIIDHNGQLLAQTMISGDHWHEQENMLLTASSDTVFQEVKIRLSILRDNTVNYRGWIINSIKLHSIFDEYLTTLDIAENSMPTIPLKLFSVFPNPSKGKIRLDLLSNTDDDVNVKVYNILGQLVLKRKVNSILKGRRFIDLNLSKINNGLISSGMLFVVLESNNIKVMKKCVILTN